MRLNQSAMNIEMNRVDVLIKYYFSNILFIYCYGPFHWANPTIAAMTAMVKMHTKLAGLVTMLKILVRLMRRSIPQIPNDINALVIIFSWGKWLNNFPRNPVGGWTYGTCYFWKKDIRPPELYYYFYWLSCPEEVDIFSRSLAVVDLLEFIGLEDPKYFLLLLI